MKKVFKTIALVFIACVTIFAFAGCDKKDKDTTVFYEINAFMENGVYKDKATVLSDKKTELAATADIKIFWKEKDGEIREIVANSADGKIISNEIISTKTAAVYSINFKGGKIYHAALNSNIDKTTYYEIIKLDAAPNLVA